MKEDRVDISVIVACYNEVDNISPLVEELCAVLTPLDKSFEILYVDDGSQDGSQEKILETAKTFPMLRMIRHRTNFGQSAAFHSGFLQARGRVFVTLDADLQNDPADIPRMLEILADCHMVTGIRKKRRDNFVRRMSTKVANGVRSFFLKDGIQDAGCCMRVFRREVTSQLIGFKGLHRFFPTICMIHGFKVRQTPVNHRPRIHGQAKYGIGNRLWVGIHDMFAIRWYKKRHFPVKRITEQ